MSNSLWPHGLQHPRLHCTSISPKVALFHVHWVNDAIYPPHPLLLPSPFAFNLSQLQGFSKEWLFTSGGQSIGASASASVLPVNIHDWFPLELTGLISLMSKGLSRVFSRTTTKNHYSERGGEGIPWKNWVYLAKISEFLSTKIIISLMMTIIITAAAVLGL